ncbi:MAG TPA: hypothetical protein VID48_11880 [Solirubrobacteraceae bacterium]|jgi:hypothetical protein
MASIPLKPQYRPTLAQMLSPRWHGLPRVSRALVILAGLGVLALAIGLALTLQRASVSHGSPVPFSFEYRGLYRTPPPAGQYTRVARSTDGRLEESFTVGPLLLPAYEGSLSAELPLYAASYIRALAGRYQRFDLLGEGKTRVSTVPGYQVLYSATIEGRRMYGRDVLLAPERMGARRGVDIVMLASPEGDRRLESAAEVAGEGPLNTALHTFSFG